MQLETVANTIRSARLTHKPILIGIEGFGGSGKSTIANKLAELLGNTFVVSIDDFIIKGNITKDDWDKQAFDRKRLEDQVLKPAAESKPIIYERLLWDTNSLSDPVHVSDVDYLIVEGISSYHPSISHYYDYKIWVDTSIEIAKGRGKQRDAGNKNEQHWDLWASNDLAYQQKYHPKQVADFVISNSDLEFKKLTIDDLPELKSWFIKPNSENRFISFYADPEVWLKLIKSSDARFGYMLYRNSQAIGFLDLEVNNESASIAMGVKPELRGQGLGKLIMKEALFLPELKRTKKIKAGVELDNIASQKVLLFNGFNKLSEQDGIVEFEKIL